MADAAEQCSSLTCLNLDGNPTRKGVLLVKLHLFGRDGRSGHLLDARHKGITDADVGRLAPVLTRCAALAELDFVSNRITDEGAQVLAEVVAHNAALTSVNLEFNKVTDVGAQKLAEAIKRNPSLVAFSVARNPTRRGNLLVKLALLGRHNRILSAFGENLEDAQMDLVA